MRKGKYYIIEVFEDGTAQYFKADMDRRNHIFLGRLWSQVKGSLESLSDLMKDIQDHKGE